MRYFADTQLSIQVLECLSSALKVEGQQARRAAANSVSIIITGLAARCFDVLGGNGLKKLYRALKHCVNTETDDVTLHHCAVAIETLDKQVKDTLFPDRSKLEKKIYVLDAPPV